PTGTKLHIGHMVGLMKIKQFQELGHEVIFLIGDGTGQAGDPSGKTDIRKKYLTRDELRQNSLNYVLQAKSIVKFSGSNAVKVKYNSDWLNKLTLVELLNLFQRFSIQQLTERDCFEKRIKNKQPVLLREAIYPILQGYDSVAMKVDLEIGGTDQMFNMLAGRILVKEMLQKEKFVMTLPLLSDSSGKKIGKTEGNLISLTANPQDLYGMIMKLPDDVIFNCFEYITDLSLAEIEVMRNELEKGGNPMIFKKKLAYTIVRMLNNVKKANEAQEYFESIFQKRDITSFISEVKLNINKPVSILELLILTKLVSSKSQAKRLVVDRAVEINKEIVTNPKQIISIIKGMIIRVGKYKIIKINNK
ncbi:tyrosine--tRNA ligase, partial [Candidatus Gottesmanbacteria bacterium RBG_13_37_7]